MKAKPELVAFSQYKLGGVLSYYYSLLSNDIGHSFNKKWILTNESHDKDAKPLQLYDCCEQVIFNYDNTTRKEELQKLSNLVSDTPGVVLVNHEIELEALHRFPKKKKSVFFVCHDELYLKPAKRFEHVIDVYIAHNYQFYNQLLEELPISRKKDIHYLPYGIKPSEFFRSANYDRDLNIFFLARIVHKKGIYDLSRIDDILVAEGISVNWNILGDGPERENLIASLSQKRNFNFFKPETQEEVYRLAAANDIFILPSYLDGLPVALLEAMSCGLVPLLYHFNTGIERVVDSNIGFIVPVGGVTEAASKIMFLYSHRVILETLSSNSIKRIRSDFEVTKRAMEYYKLFNKYKELKLPYRYKRMKGEGRLDNPKVPAIVRFIGRSFLKFVDSK